MENLVHFKVSFGKTAKTVAEAKAACMAYVPTWLHYNLDNEENDELAPGLFSIFSIRNSYLLSPVTLLSSHP